MIGGAIAAACSDPDVLAHLGGPLGEAARAKAAELRYMPPPKRKQARALIAATTRAPVPAGLRGIDPSWIEASLAELPARAREDLASGGMRQAPSGRGEFDTAGVWLARWASASLAPMPPADVTRPKTILDVTRMSADALVEWLADVGADQLAFALGDAAKGAARKLGERMNAAIKRIPKYVDKLGPRRAAIARCSVELDGDALVTIGMRAIAPYCDATVRRQIALRLPRTRGIAALFELVQWAGEAGESPTWEALATK